MNTNAQLSNLNRPTKAVRPSSLSQEFGSEDLSDVESIAGSNNDDEEFDELATKQLFDLLTTDAEEESRTKKSKRKASKTDAGYLTRFLIIYIQQNVEGFLRWPGTTI